MSDLRERIEKTLVPEPPLTFADGGVIAAGIDRDLDELRELSRNSKAVLAQIEQRERGRTGISSLKVKFNSVFGYYIEVSKSNLHLVPQDYDRKQTLVGAERFTTPELKEYEAKILDAQEKIVDIERRLFTELRTAIAAEAKRIRQTALALAEVDVLGSLAHIAALRNYCRPQFVEGSSELEIIEGRHPVIELQELAGGSERFVPNDLYLNDTTHNILLLTGPNMRLESGVRNRKSACGALRNARASCPLANRRDPGAKSGDRWSCLGALRSLSLPCSFLLQQT